MHFIWMMHLIIDKITLYNYVVEYTVHALVHSIVYSECIIWDATLFSTKLLSYELLPIAGKSLKIPTYL